MRKTLRYVKERKNRTPGNDDDQKRLLWGRIKNSIMTSQQNRRVKISLHKVELPE